MGQANYNQVVRLLGHLSHKVSRAVSVSIYLSLYLSHSFILLCDFLSCCTFSVSRFVSFVYLCIGIQALAHSLSLCLAALALAHWLAIRHASLFGSVWLYRASASVPGKWWSLWLPSCSGRVSNLAKTASKHTCLYKALNTLHSLETR